MCARFLNPYHFVSLQEQKSLWEQDGKEETYTGVLHYTVKTKTPLLIPGKRFPGKTTEQEKVKQDKNEHPYIRFFTYDDTGEDDSLLSKYQPAIPGSEIRGTIRSIYETLTNSCLSMVDTEKAVTRRISDIFQPGLIKRTQHGNEVSYELLKASRAQANCKVVDSKNLKDGAACRGKLNGNRFLINDEGPETGYLLKGEMPDEPVGRTSKSHYSIFLKDESAKKPVSLLDNQQMEDLKYVIAVYDDPKMNKQINDKHTHWYNDYREELEAFLDGKDGEFTGSAGHEPLFPVFYSIVGKTGLYLSPACITKEIYHTRIGDIIKGYEPCSRKQDMCPACRLFGMAGENNEETTAGKLRFTDLLPVTGTESYYYHGAGCDKNGMVTLQELSNPKLSAAEFYLYKPEKEDAVVFSWNYDYYVCKTLPDEPVLQMRSDGYQPRIMGRKYYWHNLSPDFTTDQKTNRNQTVQLVDEEKSFSGKIYFEDISRTELRRLYWICNISSQWKGHGYKTGGGKPLGLGSVEMQVTDLFQRTLSMQDGRIHYNEREKLEAGQLFDGTDNGQDYYAACNFEDSVKQQFKMMTKFLNGKDIPDHKKITISYPIAYNTDHDAKTGKKAEGFQWFANNRVDACTGSRKTLLKRMNVRFDQHMEELPKEIPEKEELSILEKVMLESTITIEPAIFPDAPKKDINTPKRPAIKKKEARQPVASSKIKLGQSYTAVVTKIEPSKKMCMIYFTLENGTAGKILVKKSQSQNFQKGSRITVRCKTWNPSNPIFDLVK